MSVCAHYVFDDVQQLFSLGTVTDTISPLFPAPTSGPEMLRIVGTSSTTIFCFLALQSDCA